MRKCSFSWWAAHGRAAHGRPAWWGCSSRITASSEAEESKHQSEDTPLGPHPDFPPAWYHLLKFLQHFGRRTWCTPHVFPPPCSWACLLFPSTTLRFDMPTCVSSMVLLGILLLPHHARVTTGGALLQCRACTTPSIFSPRHSVERLIRNPSQTLQT